MSNTGLIRLSVALGLCLTGCTGSTPAPSGGGGVAVSPTTVTEVDDHGHGHDEHGHPTEGPHHGVLAELGNEEFHAEVVHDDTTGMVTVYLLDGHAEKSVTTTATELVINLKHGDTPEQYNLVALPEDDNPAGQTSRFSLTDKELAGHLDDAAAAAKLNITINDTPYSGAIPVEDHAKHGHVHGGDDALVWRKKLEAHGYQIQLGHHGTDLHAGTKCEPAVSITKNGQDIADARVFNALLGEDGTTELVPENATIYEPATPEEPAHYAQGSLMIPAAIKQVTLRFRIVLPQNAGEAVELITVPVK